MNRNKLGLRLETGGMIIGIVGFFLTAAMLVVNRDPVRGTWVFSVETVGLIVLAFGFVLAAVGIILAGYRWRYGPIK